MMQGISGQSARGTGTAGTTRTIARPLAARVLSTLLAAALLLALSAPAAQAATITVSSGVTVSGALPHTVSATTTSSTAIGIYSSGSMTLGNASGTVNAASTSSLAYGIYAFSGALTITNGISGAVTATSGGSGNAYGVQSRLNAFTISSGGISGTVSATANGSGSAYGLYDFASSIFILNGGVSGTLSATDTSGSGNAYAIQSKYWEEDYDTWHEVSAVNLVKLLSGAKLLGKVDLAAGADTLTLTGPNITITGQVDGGAGTDTLALTGSARASPSRPRDSLHILRNTAENCPTKSASPTPCSLARPLLSEARRKAPYG